MDEHVDGHEETVDRPEEGLYDARQDNRPQDWFEVMRGWWDQPESGATDSAR
ncbi:MAG: hypothetical protein M0Z54_04315 [Thermaerobacter sp.]|nr:hypothetical protein [Thermaerobacter sp.]